MMVCGSVLAARVLLAVGRGHIVAVVMGMVDLTCPVTVWMVGQHCMVADYKEMVAHKRVLPHIPSVVATDSSAAGSARLEIGPIAQQYMEKRA
jgi:hypothetical protein